MVMLPTRLAKPGSGNVARQPAEPAAEHDDGDLGHAGHRRQHQAAQGEEVEPLQARGDGAEDGEAHVERETDRRKVEHEGGVRLERLRHPEPVLAELRGEQRDDDATDQAQAEEQGERRPDQGFEG